MQFPKMLEDVYPEGKVVHTSKVAHVTFYIVKLPYPYDDEEKYKLFSESEKDGAHELDPCDYVHNYNDHFESYEEVTTALVKAQINLEHILERKREHIPTEKQVYFLFTHKIPIPIDLTWGQASDIIDEKLNQIAREKQARQLEKYRGFEVGMRVAYGKFTATITKLTSGNQGIKYAHIKFDDNGYTWHHPLSDLKKIDQEEL